MSLLIRGISSFSIFRSCIKSSTFSEQSAIPPTFLRVQFASSAGLLSGLQMLILVRIKSVICLYYIIFFFWGGAWSPPSAAKEINGSCYLKEKDDLPLCPVHQFFTLCHTDMEDTCKLHVDFTVMFIGFSRYLYPGQQKCLGIILACLKGVST